MQIIRDVEQGSQEWLDLRCAIVTCSELNSLLVNGKGPGGFGAGAITYMDTLIGESFTGEVAGGWSGNAHTERGHELEPMADDLYKERTGNDTERVSIILNHGVGYSPDYIIGDNGLTEIKTKLPKYQVSVILADEIPKEHVAQCQGGLWVSEREWIDFISFWPGMPLFVKRVYRDEEMISRIESRVKDFYEVMQERIEQVTNLST